MIRWSSAHWYTALASFCAFVGALCLAVSISDGTAPISWAWWCFWLAGGAWLGFAVLVHEWKAGHVTAEKGSAKVIQIGER